MATIRTEERGRVGVITLDRPEALNALNDELMADVLAAATAFDRDAGIGAVVITGSERAFAAGADVKAMAGRTPERNAAERWMSGWDEFAALGVPKIAAVRGLALGGGCELAMMCDLIIAAEDAQFGQPELALGLVPGLGATQRLTRAVGKARAMDLILTGRRLPAAEALEAGLVSRLVPSAEVLETAVAVATTIAGYSAPAVRAARRLIARAEDSTLVEGIAAERAVFYRTFGNADAIEGIAAFIEKRTPDIRHR